MSNVGFSDFNIDNSTRKRAKDETANLLTL